jgi:lysophospholipase L1-like esterase
MNNAVDLGVMASPPTITVGTTRADGTLTNLYTAAGDANLANFTHLGGVPLNYTNVYWRYPVVTRASGGNVATTQDANDWAVEFYTDSPSVEMLVLNTTDTTGWMVEVDGRPVAATAQAYAATSGGSYILLAFGSAATRKIRYESRVAGGFGRAYVKPTASIWPTGQQPEAIRAAVVGDSLVVGTGATIVNGGWAYRLGKILGWTDVRAVSLGGTGFANPGSVSSTFGDTARVADLVTANPDILLTMASSNDDGRAGLQAAALAAFQAYRSALPKVPIVAIGAPGTSTGPSASRLTNEAAVKAAFDAWGDPNSWWIPNSNDPVASWFTGTGKSGTLSGTGDSDVYTGTDGTHPVQIGHDYLARRVARAMRASVLGNVA